MGNSILSLTGISKSFADTPVLKSIDLSVDQGEFITLLGSSGCGKTTTLRIIAGLETADTGSVTLDGVDVTHFEPNRRDVNTVFQNYALFPHMDVATNIGYSLKLKKVKKTEIAERVDEMLRLVQLEGFGKRLPSELSGGQRQRVAIARSLINQPKILLLDEPLGALDLRLRQQMQIELKKLQQQLGITFIYITHDQEEALNMSDRIAVMQGGQFEQIGTPDDIYNRPKTAYVAQFVGSANIIRGQVSAVADGRATLSTSSGDVTVDAPTSAVGDKLVVAVRTEQTHLSDDLSMTGLQATVGELSFVGNMLRTTVMLADGCKLVASKHGLSTSLTVGQTVTVTFDPVHGMLVEDSADES